LIEKGKGKGFASLPFLFCSVLQTFRSSYTLFAFSKKRPPYHFFFTKEKNEKCCNSVHGKINLLHGTITEMGGCRSVGFAFRTRDGIGYRFQFGDDDV
jgi:hypothetical protein